jgi:DNA modification methylase
VHLRSLHGHGRDGAAALTEGKSFIGIEKNPLYFAMAVKRIKGIYRDRLAKLPEG